ncbi:hypothetical protein QR680_016396 [Steinernema hermaphroditum]|uniref:Cytochrome P450 n=1 Tax=Steinernema hermaphroditum TaxID=289476 RepID=A0AA39HB32_9BILA|nr:hypothetical protein QR680_016396 [Steinernema hermaphroditum]
MINVLVGLLILLLYWIRSVRRKDLPPGPTPLPLLGNAHQLFWAYLRGRSHVDVFLDWKKVYGNVYTIYLGPYHCVLICDYQTTFDAFIKSGEDHAGRNNTFIFNNPRNDLGVIFSKGPGWQEQRRFSLKTLRDFGFGRNIMQLRILEEFDYRAERLDKLFDDNDGQPLVMDPRSFFDLMITSIINRILIGYRYDEEHMHLVHTMKHDLDKQFENLTIWDFGWITKHTYKLPLFKQRFEISGRAQEVMFDIFREAVKRRRAELDSGEHQLNFESGGDDYLDAYMIMLERKREKGEFLGWFTDENLAVNLGDLWMAGNMTTLETMQWFLVFCLNNPGIQEKMREEAFSITKGNRHILMTDRPYMPYTNAVVTEVLRCASIFNFNLIHETTHETVVGGYLIPKKTTLTAQISVIMKDEENFKDPEKFDPDRYIRDPELVKKVIPFSLGKRSCVGESLARAEMFLITSNFVQKYNFSNVDDAAPPTTEEIFCMLFQKRSKRLRMRIQPVVY